MAGMARLWMAPSGIVALLITLGPLASHLGLVRPEAGFFPFFLGIFLAFMSGISLAGAAAYATSTGRSWRRRALLGSVVPLALSGAIIVVLTLNPAPSINDVSTDLEERPVFGAAADAGLRYPPHDELTLEAFAEIQREFYPELQPVSSPRGPAASQILAVEVARELGWQVAVDDAASGRVEAVATTRVFRFEDDVAIRIRPDGDGSRLDLRSRSRFGRGDLGANAARIARFAARFRAALR